MGLMREAILVSWIYKISLRRIPLYLKYAI